MFKHKIICRRETKDIWQSQNPVLEKNAMGVEIILDADRIPEYYNIKLGDGSTPWNTLNYFYTNLNADDTDEIIDDFYINIATRKPVEDFIPIYNENNTLKSGPPVEEDDVIRKTDVATIIDATDFPTAGKVARYNASAGLKSAKMPTENNDVVRFLDLTTHENNTHAHNATDAPTPSRIAMYNGDAGLKSGKIPTENNDVVRFLEFNDEVSSINSKISTLNGAYYVFDSYNFGKTLDETDPDDILILNTYAIANTPGATSMADVYNDSVIVNEFDSAEYVYNKIAEVWVKYPNGYLTVATNDHLGVVKGTQPPADPTDESKDTYVQVLADGAMKLVGDRLGKVNSVDGVAPNSDKDIELTIAMTKADFAALEDPVGSGKYPSLKGKNVILTDIYPEGRLFPLPDYANMESTNRISVNNGTWTADRSGYVELFVYATNSSSDSITGPEVRYSINNKVIQAAVVTVPLTWSGNYYMNILPVKKGDVVKIAVSAYHGDFVIDSIACYFIPPIYVNAPASRIVIEQGSDYSLTEQQVLIWDPVTQTSRPKLWVDGSPVYKQTIKDTAPLSVTTGGWYVVKTNLGLKQVILCKGFYKSQNNLLAGVRF
jgi:hypothetical protein